MSVLEAIPKTSIGSDFATHIAKIMDIPESLFPKVTKPKWSVGIDYGSIYSVLDEIENLKGLAAHITQINNQLAEANAAISAATIAANTVMSHAARLTASDIHDDTIPQSWIDDGCDVIDKARAIELLTEVAASVPDGHFDSRKNQSMPNVYFIGEMGSCIIGRMFERLGYTHGDLTYHSYAGEPIAKADATYTGSAGVLNTGSIGRVYPSNMRITPAAHWLLQQAQIDNDQATPWTRIAEQATV